MKKINYQKLWGFLTILLLISIGTLATQASAQTGETKYYKMYSGVQYDGQGQFRSQAETSFVVEKTNIVNNIAGYVISMVKNDPTLLQAPHSDIKTSLSNITFSVDRQSQTIISRSNDLIYLSGINNTCADMVNKVGKDHIGKTWKQKMDLSVVSDLLGNEVEFDVSAIEVKSDKKGKMYAVRAISKPYSIKNWPKDSKIQEMKTKTGALYLFDADFENIYMSIYVFEATAKVNGKTEKLWHEISTFETDAIGKAVDLSGLSKNFEKFAQKVGLSSKSVKIKKTTELPAWASVDALKLSQIMNVCASVTCEGALNPVVTVVMPSSKMMALQSVGQIGVGSSLPNVARSLAKNLPGMGSMKVAIAPAIMGVSATTAGVVGGSVGAVSISGGSSGGGSSRSSSTP